VRHRATRPAFTVEVKRRRSKSPHPFTTPEGHPREGLRREGLLAAFSPESSARSSLDWGDLIKSSLSQERAPSSTATPTAEPTAKIRTGRILPDVLGGQLAAEGFESEADERALEDHAKQSKVNEDARQRERRAETLRNAKHIQLSGDARIAGISPVPSAEASELPQANVRPAESGGTASSMMSARSHSDAASHLGKKAKGKRVLSGADRRAKRSLLPVPLKRGERWKRRLPEVCW
jgi:hypothetical protein